jgi:hypothetical protein
MVLSRSKPHVMQRFMEKFNTQSELRLDTFLPCYGLAEVTLLVSGVTGPLNAISIDRDKLNAQSDTGQSRSDRRASGELWQDLGTY